MHGHERELYAACERVILAKLDAVAAIDDRMDGDLTRFYFSVFDAVCYGRGQPWLARAIAVF